MTPRFEPLFNAAVDVGEVQRGGGLIEVRSQGLRFATGDAKLAWLNRTIAVATAARRARRVELDVFRLL